ncbi:MAG: hypothetical protein CK424_00410 [Legionella sp.]|nr:MAG: hypothetical protein CK424_00410 [Legionella sp.]
MGTNRNDPSNRRAQQNKQFNKNRSRPQSKSVAEDSESISLLGSHKRHVKVAGSMSSNRALGILELQGFPFHSDIHKASTRLMAKYGVENQGNPRKYQEIIVAKNQLDYRQTSLLKEFQSRISEKMQTAKKALDDLQLAHKHHKFPNLIEEMQRLNDQFFKDLRHPTADIKTLQTTYNKECKRIHDSIFRHNNIPHEFQSAFSTAIREVSVNLDDLKTVALPLNAPNDEEDPVDMFKAQYNDYLEDILALKETYKHHQKVFTRLHSLLEELRDKFCDHVSKPGANLDEASTVYSTSFREIVTQAKQAFEKEPGIWANLHPILKYLANLVFFVKNIIATFEAPEDRHRMFQPDKQTITERWAQWEMDTMPELDINKMPLNRPSSSK